MQDITYYAKMPSPFIVLGFMFVIVAAFYIIFLIKNGYWTGMLKQLSTEISCHKKTVIGAIASICILVIIVDKPVALLCHTYYNVIFYTWIDFLGNMAEGWFSGGVLLMLSWICLITQKEKLHQVFNISFMSMTFAGLVNGVLKFIFNRERPVIGMDNWHFFHFFTTGAKDVDNLFYAYNSMPSGHMITIVAAVVPLFLYWKSKVARAILIFIAIIIMLARVYTLNHWFSDVSLSTLLGILIGVSCYSINRYRLITKDR